MVAYHRALRVAIMCSPLALGACGSGPTAPPVIAPPAPMASNAGADGNYKIGKPYQVEGLWYYPAEDYSYAEEGIASWYGADFHGKRTANGNRYDMNELTAAHPTLPMPSVVKVTNLDNGRVLKLTVNDRGPFHSSRIIDVSRRAAQLLGFYENGTAKVRVEIDPQESINLKNIALAKHPPEMPQIAAAPLGAVSASSLAPVAGPIDSFGVASSSVKPVVSAVPPPPSSATVKSQVEKKADPSGPPQQTASVQAPKAATYAPTKPAAKAAGGLFVQAGAFSEEANAHKLEQQLGEFGKVHIVPTTVNNKKFYRVRLGPIADAATADALVSKIKSYGYNDAKVVRE
jgi:rare lipoprotein A